MRRLSIRMLPGYPTGSRNLSECDGERLMPVDLLLTQKSKARFPLIPRREYDPGGYKTLKLGTSGSFRNGRAIPSDSILDHYDPPNSDG